MGENLTIKNVKLSKLKVDDGVAEFKVTCNVGANTDLNELVMFLNKAATVEIAPFQSDLEVDLIPEQLEDPEAVTA